MPDMPIDNYLDKILLLEERLGAKINYLIMEMNGSSIVSIKLSYKAELFPQSVLAILTHEVTHSYLFTNFVDISMEHGVMGNEILTDIAAIDIRKTNEILDYLKKKEESFLRLSREVNNFASAIARSQILNYLKKEKEDKKVKNPDK